MMITVRYKPLCQLLKKTFVKMRAVYENCFVRTVDTESGLCAEGGPSKENLFSISNQNLLL